MTREQNRKLNDIIGILDEAHTSLLDFHDYDLNGDDKLCLTDGISSLKDAIDLLYLISE